MRRTVRTRLTLLGLLLLVSAGVGCAGDAEEDRGPAREAWTDLRLVTAERLHGVQDIAAGGDAVWVLADFEPYLHRVGGGSPASFAEEGEGPGELASPQTVFRRASDGGAAGELVVWDVGTRRIVRYGPGGDHRGDDRVQLSTGAPVRADFEEISYAPAQKLEPFGDGYIVQDHPGGASHTLDVAGSRLLRLDSGGEVVDTLIDFSRRFGEEMAEVAPALELVPVPLWTVCRGHELVVLDPYVPGLLRLSEDGTRRLDTLSVPGRRITEAEKRAYLRKMVLLELESTPPEGRVEAMVTRALERNSGQLGSEAPPASRILCGPGGGIWLEAFDARDHPLGYGRDWRVVEEGTILRVVRFPEGFRPLELTENAAWGVLTDSLGVERPAVVGR